MQLRNLNEAFTWQINPVFQSRIKSQDLDFALWSNLQTQIEANVEFDDTSYPAQITNLSPTGCQLILSSKKPPTLANEVEVEITVEKHKDQESFAVKACVCNSKEVQGGLSVGVRFIEDNLPEVEALLYQALSLED